MGESWVNHGDWHLCEQGALRPNYRVPVPGDSPRSLERNRSIPHTTRGCYRRDERRERSYYHLHRNLNKLLLHMLILLCIMHY